MSTETLTISEFHARIRDQGAASREDIAFKCPICGTVQSARSLAAAGATGPFEALERYIGFSCVGRFSGAGEHKRGEPPGQGCNWTLGGFLQLHQLTILDDEGDKHPRFVLASAEETAALAEQLSVRAQ